MNLRLNAWVEVFSYNEKWETKLEKQQKKWYPYKDMSNKKDICQKWILGTRFFQAGAPVREWYPVYYLPIPVEKTALNGSGRRGQDDGTVFRSHVCIS